MDAHVKSKHAIAKAFTCLVALPGLRTSAPSPECPGNECSDISRLFFLSYCTPNLVAPDTVSWPSWCNQDMLVVHFWSSFSSWTSCSMQQDQLLGVNEIQGSLCRELPTTDHAVGLAHQQDLHLLEAMPWSGFVHRAARETQDW